MDGIVTPTVPDGAAGPGCDGAARGVIDRRAGRERRRQELPGREVDEVGVGADQAADDVVGAGRDRAVRRRPVERAEVRAGEPADHVAAGLGGDRAVDEPRLIQPMLVPAKPPTMLSEFALTAPLIA